MKKIIELVICLIVYTGFLSADNSYYYSENTGWLNFKQAESVSSPALTGWVWGENIGWIHLNPVYGGVSVDQQGKCSGYAYSENVGWINFNPTGGGVKAGTDGKKLQGWAWGENIGWIKFDSVIIDFNNNNLRILPNYLKAGTDMKPKIYFGGLEKPSDKYQVRIFTITGRNLVKNFGKKTYTDLNNGLEWDLKSDNGKDIPRGLYTVILTGDGKEWIKDFYFFK